MEQIANFGFVQDYRYELAIVGGIAKPKLEAWILCLLGIPGTDVMTRTRVDRELASVSVVTKSTEHYVEIAKSSALPAGDGSLAEWLARADATFRQLIDGVVEG
jgi:hypothetical protein